MGSGDVGLGLRPGVRRLTLHGYIYICVCVSVSVMCMLLL